MSVEAKMTEAVKREVIDWGTLIGIVGELILSLKSSLSYILLLELLRKEGGDGVVVKRHFVVDDGTKEVGMNANTAD